MIPNMIIEHGLIVVKYCRETFDVNNSDAKRKYQEMKKIVNEVITSFFSYSSIDKWGGQLKTIKRDVRDFMVLEFKGIKKLQNKNLRCKKFI